MDALIVIPNQRLLEAVKPGTSFFEAFRIADDILRQGVQGITDIIALPGVINRDFADVTTVMKGTGYAVMGMGVARGANRAVEAARQAVASPLLEDGTIQGARGVLINVTGSSNLGLHEVQEASALVQKVAHEDANIIFGAVHDDAMKEAVKITVIATGFKDHRPRSVARPPVQERGPSPARTTGKANGGSREPAPRLAPSHPQDLDVPAFLRKRLPGR